MGASQYASRGLHDAKACGAGWVALNGMMAEQQEQGLPLHWNSYVYIDNLDATAVKVTEAGGTLLMPPMDILDSGRMVMAQAPTRAVFSL